MSLTYSNWFCLNLIQVHKDFKQKQFPGNKNMLIGSVSLSFEIYCKVLSESQEKVSLKYTAGLW